MKAEDTKHILNEVELQTIKCLDKEREISDERYALKIVERIVFTLVAALCLAVIGALIKLVVAQ